MSLSHFCLSLPPSLPPWSLLYIPTSAQGPPAELHGLRRRRRSVLGLGVLNAPEGGLEEVLASLTSLSLELEQLQRPSGTAESPGLVCGELHRNHPHLPDGEVLPLPRRAGSRRVPPPLTRPTWLCGRGILDRPQPGLRGGCA